MSISIYTGTRKVLKPAGDYNIVKVEVLNTGESNVIFTDDRTKFNSPFYDFNTLINKFVSLSSLNGGYLNGNSQKVELTALKKDLSLQYYVDRNGYLFITYSSVSLIYDLRRSPKPIIDNSVISRPLVDYIAPLSNCIVCTTYNSSGLTVSINNGEEDLDEFTASFSQAFDASISSETLIKSTANTSTNNYIPVTAGNIVEIGSWRKRILDDCSYNAQLIYYNQMGGFEMLPLRGKGISNYEPTSDIRHFQQVHQANIRNNVQSYNFNLPNTNTSLSETIRFTLPFINVDRTPYIEDLIKSPVCWLQYGNDIVYQVIIDNLNEVNRNKFQVQYTIDLKYSINTLLR